MDLDEARALLERGGAEHADEGPEQVHPQRLKPCVRANGSGFTV